jgi:outer membrane protein
MESKKIAVISDMNTMIKTIRWGLAFLLLAGSSLSIAQAQQPLTLKDALDYALNNSEALKKARLDIETGRLKVAEVRGSALPQIDGVSTLTNNLLVQQFILPAEFMGGNPGEFIAVKAGQTWNAMSQVQLSQQIFNQQVFTGLKAAKGSEAYYRLAAQLSEENLIQQVATNYYQVIITREQLEVIDANLERISQLEKMVASQYEVGLAKKIDLDRIKVNKGNLLAQREQLEYAVVQQENLLKYYMGMPISESIQIAEADVVGLEKQGLALSGQDNFNVDNLTAYQLLGVQEDLLELQRKAYIAEYFPSLSLGGNYMYNSQSNSLNVYSNKALNYDVASVSLNLRVPIFDGFKRRSKVSQANIELEKVREDLRQTNNALAMSYENAKIQLKNNLNTIETQFANKEFAQEVFESTQANYKNGLATLTDLLTAETELVAAQNSYNQALLNFKVAEIELIKSNGNIKSLVK